jgi:hypothetical protein
MELRQLLALSKEQLGLVQALLGGEDEVAHLKCENQALKQQLQVGIEPGKLLDTVNEWVVCGQCGSEFFMPCPSGNRVLKNACHGTAFVEHRALLNQ